MSRHGGFTVIQLLMVIIIISIVAATASVRAPSTDAFQTEGFSSVLLQDLRMTSVLSMTQNQQYRIVFSANAYSVQDQNGSALTNYPEIASGVITFPTGVTVTPNPTPSGNTIIFDSLGHPFDGAGAALATTTFAVNSNGRITNVTLNAETGYVQ